MSWELLGIPESFDVALYVEGYEPSAALRTLDFIDQARSPKSNQELTSSASSTSGSQTPSILPIR